MVKIEGKNYLAEIQEINKLVFENWIRRNKEAKTYTEKEKETRRLQEEADQELEK